MTISVLQNAFFAGEFSPGNWARSDLEKYDFGLRQAENIFPNYRGGISNRPGTKLVGELLTEGQEFRLIPFRVSNSVGDNYVLIFTHDRIFFAQSGGFVLEAEKDILSLSGNPDRLEVTGHGYATGDLVYIYDMDDIPRLEGVIAKIVVTSANHFRIYEFDGTGYNVGSAYVSGAHVARLVSVPHSYAAEDLGSLTYHQSGNDVILTHASYAPQKLTRSSHTSWTLGVVLFGPGLGAPLNPVATASSAGSAGTTFCVVGVGPLGERSIESRREFLLGSVNYALTAGSAKFTWTPLAGASYYEVYRSRIASSDANVIYSNEVGFIGNAFGPQFVDDNIIPDFTKTPTQFVDPFASGAISAIEITAPGTGYDREVDDVVITDPTGTGFSGFPIIDDTGAILGVFIRRPGRNYTAPVVSFTTVGGSGATATASTTQASGLWPACSTTFQQRRLYAGSDTYPTTVWGSRPGRPNDFSVTVAGAADDAYTLSINGQTVNPVRHLVPMQAGLIAFADDAVWLLRGGDRALTPEDALVDPQTHKGCSALPPIVIDTDILYLQRGGSVVRSITYNFVHQLFVGTDRSILSGHLFTADNPIVRWTYAAEPFSLVKAIRQDGTALAMFHAKELDAYGWTRYITQGYYRDTVTVVEGVQDVTYFAVERFVGGKWKVFLEREDERNFRYSENCWFLDCAVANELTAPAAAITVSGLSGDVDVTADASVFTSADIGSLITFNGARLRITTYTSGTAVSATYEREVGTYLPEGLTTPPLLAAGEWLLGAPTSTLSGLWHLEGSEVSVLADGVALGTQAVSNGRITLPYPAVNVLAGLPYTSIGRVLPVTVAGEAVEGKRKRIIGATASYQAASELSFGSRIGSYWPMPENEGLVAGVPPDLQTGSYHAVVNGSFDYAGEFVFVQDKPLPFTLTQLVLTVELGDDEG